MSRLKQLVLRRNSPCSREVENEDLFMKIRSNLLAITPVIIPLVSTRDSSRFDRLLLFTNQRLNPDGLFSSTATCHWFRWSRAAATTRLDVLMVS